MTHTTAPHILQVWREVIVLLLAAADRGYDEAVTDPARHHGALWAEHLAAAAIALLPPGQVHLLDQVDLDPATGQGDLAALVRAAHHTAEGHHLADHPRAAAALVHDLADLAGLAGQVRS